MIRITRPILVKIIVLLIVLGTLIGGLMGTQEYLSWKNVTFTLSSGTKSVTIYYSEQNPDHVSDLDKAATVDASSTIRLKVGSYIAIPNGDSIANTPIVFEVKDARTVNIDPYYSDDYLTTTFAGEIDTINKVVDAKYPIIATKYVIETGRFSHFGDWYATTLYNSSPEPGEGVDIYGVILHKTDGEWVVVGKPEIVFTYTANPDIPRDVVDSTNRFIYDL